MDANTAGYSQGYSYSHSECISRCDSVSTGQETYSGSPATIARDIFTAEVQDVLVVLRNCGALRTRAERFWCLQELWRLLAEPSPGDRT
jgi:hypothetical protein